uniref:Uncharacterized protein n=1 Tax=Rhodnius prolixus TaxID=13249 RepID=T1HIH6_RHOPR
MDQLKLEVEKYSMEKEAELQLKIKSLECEMVQLYNKLLVEKSKLDQTIAEQYVPVPDNNNLSSALNVEHLPQCPNSRMVLEIDPNCKLHGHVYSKHSESAPTSRNAQSILSMFNKKSKTDLLQVSSYAGGDINKNDDNSINLTSIPPESGDQVRNSHLTNYAQQNLETLNVSRVQTSNRLNSYHQLGQSTQSRESTNEDIIGQNQTSYTEKLENILNNSINQSGAAIKEHSVIKKNVYNNLKSKSRVNICKILEINDYPKCSVNLQNFDDGLRNLDGTTVEQAELAILKAFNITETNNKMDDRHDDEFAQLLQEIASSFKN